jgi:hypothetical protein
MQVEVDFDVFKALTALRLHEGHTYNDVLRDLLHLGQVKSYKIQPSSIATAEPAIGTPTLTSSNGLWLRGLFLPDGTLLRGSYKGKLHQAQIENGGWHDERGQQHTSPSAAAYAISNTNINGWRFWEAKRPSDTDWRKLETLQKNGS